MNAKPRLLLAVAAIGVAVTLTACHTPDSKSASATPCMDVLPHFTAASVPALGPGETPAPAGRWTNGITPPNLPGKGLAQHPMLIVCENYAKMFLVNEGKIIWTYQTGNREYPWEYDDVWMLSNGNILFSRMEYAEEITPGKKNTERSPKI